MAPPAAGLGNLELSRPPEAMHPLAIDGPAFSAQERPDSPIAVAGMALGQDGEALRHSVVSVCPRMVLHRRAIGSDQGTGSPLRDPALHQEPHGLALVGRL